MADSIPAEERSRFLPERTISCLIGKKALSRRSLLRSAFVGGVGIAAAQLASSLAGEAKPPFKLDPPDPRTVPTPKPALMNRPTMGDPGTLLQVDSGPIARNHNPYTQPNYNSYALGQLPYDRAVGGGTGGNLALVNSLLRGNGLYIGNEFDNWSDLQRQAVFHQIRSWGFDFVCPKVGGYSATKYYSSVTQLTNWKNWANAAGLEFLPFIYEIPNDAKSGAGISVEIANVAGISVVDLEDEWTTVQNGTTPTKDDIVTQGVAMALFGSTYRASCPNIPIIVTGYGDPTSRFPYFYYPETDPNTGNPVIDPNTGKQVQVQVEGWPFSEMAAWADAYSPQWYYGDWVQYSGEGTTGVKNAIGWGSGECGDAFGTSFPFLPSLEIYDIYHTKSGTETTPGVAAPVSSGSYVLPASDSRAGSSYARLWRAPIIWWEYTDMTASIAATIVSHA